MALPIPPTAFDWQNFFNVVGYTAVIAVAVTMAFMIFFTVYYWNRKGPKRVKPRKGLHKSRARDAVVFAAISISILFIMNVLSFTMTPNARFLPNNPSLEIHVVAYQWGFTFYYPNGVQSFNVLNVPANTTVLLNVTSPDVMHNLYIPDFRVSIDAIPGRNNAIWIATPEIVGNASYSYRILCKELCGVGHTFMFASMTVMPQADYDQFLATQNTTKSGG